MIEIDTNAIAQAVIIASVMGFGSWIVKLLMDIRKDLHKVSTDVEVAKVQVRTNTHEIRDLKAKVENAPAMCGDFMAKEGTQ